MMTFEEFVNSGSRNAWVKEPGRLELYVRVSLPTTGTDYDLANMVCRSPGKGSLTNFLDKYEPKHTFMIENVMNVRLRDYFVRRGYVVIDGMGFGFGSYVLKDQG